MLTDIFAVIADRTRRDILQALRSGDKAVGELVEALSASQPTVSKHLKVLRDAGLVTTRAQGQKRFYALRVEPLAEVGGWLAGLAQEEPRTTAPSPTPADAAPPAAAPAVPEPVPEATPEAAADSGEELALVPAGVVRLDGKGEQEDTSRPAQLQRTVERTAARVGARATEIMANLPKFGRRK
ncbi:hypothetical protein GCM10012320_22040 [Sinomonas cellulolyticus]|uniref:Winged helix-turn-helix transcriptional regulator n=1 Tax=Sinomonas cellulolyticus TaxID=2801916 RepID=A0ABS1K323_9MICC|nr:MULTISPECIES: metalloregulator ArsR/SmtB family transcription factor [Sinomonas]MBL0705712.1 winged helix-turn-helix transcriptional regulator [Sinomonas cellulolyticus]GHG52075.1 hypothetical protein GCM10012320_22040 [Sinomonas sp. KCTC 49339]